MNNRLETKTDEGDPILVLLEKIDLLMTEVSSLRAEVAEMSRRTLNYEVDLNKIIPIPAGSHHLDNPICARRYDDLNSILSPNRRIIRENIEALTDVISRDNVNAVLANLAMIESLGEMDKTTGITSDQRTIMYQCAFRIMQVILRLQLSL